MDRRLRCGLLRRKFRWHLCLGKRVLLHVQLEVRNRGFLDLFDNWELLYNVFWLRNDDMLYGVHRG